MNVTEKYLRLDKVTCRLITSLVKVIGFYLLLFYLIFPTVLGQTDSTLFTIAAGPTQGTYYKLATLLSNEFEKLFPDSGLEVIPTRGSRENARLLEEGKVDFAIIQNDVAYLESYFDDSTLGLTSLFTEPVHVLARKELSWESLSDIGRSETRIRFGVGPRGGGTFPHANKIISVLDLKEDQVEIIDTTQAESFKLLKNREIDVLFYTVGLPAQLVQAYTKDNILKFLDMGQKTVKKIRKSYPFFISTQIPYRNYSGMNKSINTLGVKAILVARKEEQKGVVTELLTALYTLRNNNPKGYRFLSEITKESAYEGMTLELHPGAKEFFSQQASLLTGIVNRIGKYIAPILIILIPVILLLKIPSAIRLIHEYVFGRLFVVVVFVWLFGSAIMFFIENNQNDNFSTFGKSTMAILFYLFSGLESYYPVTTAGTIISLFILSLGVALATYFTGTIVTSLIERSLGINHIRKKPPRIVFPLKDHVVIAGWGDRTENIVKQLRKDDLKSKPLIIIVTDNSKNAVFQKGAYRGVWLVEGDYTNPKTLIKAGIQKAKTALILSDNPSNSNSDLKTIVTGAEIERINRKTHTVAEALRIQSADQLSIGYVDEVISFVDYTTTLVSQCIITHGVSDFFNEVVSFGFDSQEFYFIDIPELFVRMRFKEMQKAFHYYFEILLVGYLIEYGDDTRQIFVNPVNRIITLPRNTGNTKVKLVVLADEKPDPIHVSKRYSKTTKLRLSEVVTENETSSTLKRKGSTMAIFNDKGEFSIIERNILICHWSEKTRKIIEQLRSDVLRDFQNFHITIIVSPEDERVGAEVNAAETFNNVHFVYGDPTRKDVLEKVGLKQMDTIVVLANNSEIQYTDYKSLIVAQTAKHIKNSIHVVVEVVKSENIDLFERTDNFEIVSVTDVTEKLMAQATITPGLVSIFSDLLRATNDTNEIYIVPVPKRWINMKYFEISEEIIHSTEPFILLGYREHLENGDNNDFTSRESEYRLVINPSNIASASQIAEPPRRYSLKEGDALVFMAYHRPVLE